MARSTSLSGLQRSETQRLQNLAGLTITASAVVLSVVAILLNSTTLFYMTTAMIATIGACRLQAYLSVRGLRLERVAPPSVQAGDLVTVSITVWSDRRIRRPLVTIKDNLPKRLYARDVSPSLPIAPAYDVPIRTQYQFRPPKRGKYQWSGLTVEGTDALGLVTMSRRYDTEMAYMTVLPMPVPVSLELPNAAGWGISEAVSGQSRGAGMEPRGVREYASGDSLRHVHWRSSARAGQLLVKEFEAGSNAAAAIIIQRTSGSEVGVGAKTTLEAMCSHAVYLADAFLRQGARVEFPVLEEPGRSVNMGERMAEIMDLVAGVQADSSDNLGADALVCLGLPPGSTVFVLMAVADRSLLGAAPLLHAQGSQLVPLLYDANLFVPRGHRLRSESAVSPAFIDELRASQAHPVVIPTEYYPR